SLSVGTAVEVSRTVRLHQSIMVRFQQLLSDEANWELGMAELSDALEVSSRLLRNLCVAQLGMSPARYIQLQRLSLARRVLLRGATGGMEISEVAQHYRFHSPARFAVAYREAFGETPSATLRRTIKG